MDENKTLELISIDVIERIVKTQEEYEAFMKKEGIYANISEESYVVAINQYMDYAIHHSEDLINDDFERVNYLNISYGYNKMYSFQEYLAKTTPMISIATLMLIITDEDAFNRFMDFDNNRDYFEDVDIEIYLGDLFNLINYYNKSSIQFSNEQLNYIDKIKKKYSLRIKRFVSLEGYKVNGSDINPEFFYEVIKGIDITREQFYVARAVYISLAKLVTYDPTFLALDQDLSNDTANSIYNKSIDSISPTNNRIACKEWAELYSSILNLLGINAVVTGDKHKYVTFDCDGTKMKADATNTHYSSNDNVSMPDITRIQAGLSTAGYTCIDEDKDISDSLKIVDDELDFITSTLESKLASLEKQYLSIKVREGNYPDKVIDVINFLNEVTHNSTLNNFELIKYILSLGKILFNRNHILNVETHFICVKIDSNTYDAASIIAFMDEDSICHYIVLSKDYSEELEKSELKTRIASGDIKVLGKNPSIMGIGLVEGLNGYTK